MTKVTEEELIKAATGKRVTLDALNANIADEKFIKATDVLTICVLTLKNGFTVTGESACADPANYNQEIGERLAREQAKNKIWGLMGYSLKDEINRDKALLAGRVVECPEGFETYVGTKVIDATPMTRLSYIGLRGWELPANEDGNDEGYLVHYTDSTTGNVEGYPGYISWSPKDVFEKAYHPVGSSGKVGEGDFKTRVRNEARELEDKITKLDAFTKGNVQFERLTVNEQNDLNEQLWTMREYHAVLLRRIAGF